MNLYRGISISGLSCDSRKVKAGDLFFAIPGECHNGSYFIEEAIQKGCVGVVTQEKYALKYQEKCPVFLVENVLIEMALTAKQFYRFCEADHAVFAVTGTNGKTTTTYLIRHLNSKKTAVIGTIECDLVSEKFCSQLTTPLANDLFEWLSKIPQNADVALEISSHGLEMKRTFGLKISVAIFSNLTSDHLDFHKNKKNYFLSKRKLFSGENGAYPELNIINADDVFGQRLLKEFGGISFGIESGDFFTTDICFERVATSFTVNHGQEKVKFKIPLLGRFNIYNVLGSVAALNVYHKIPLGVLAERMKNFSGVPGRMELISTRKDVSIFIDFAHTPDGLKNVLSTLKNQCPGKLIVVFGCGGDRDRTKRPQMMFVANSLADIVIVTADNPRHEELEQIFDDMKPGVCNPQKVFWEKNRETAIQEALSIAQSGDIVLLAGKGHEKYQQIGSVKYPFSEAEIVKNFEVQ